MTRIAVLGSANMDLVVRVPRAPKPGETVTGRSFSTVPGGKGANQALAAARAGGTVSFLGAVGDDAYGVRLRTLLADEGIDVSGLVRVPGPSGTAHILVEDGGENSIVVVPGANGTVRSLTDAHRERIAAADVLLLQLELPVEAIAQAASFARGAGVRTVLTPAPVTALPDSLLADVDLLVPNQHEAAALTGLTDAEAAGRALQRYGCDVVITLGADGCRCFGAGDSFAAPAFPVPVVDTTAAGDTFVGALAAAGTSDVRAGVRRAAAAAALSVGRTGASAAIPYRTEIDQFLKDHP